MPTKVSEFEELEEDLINFYNKMHKTYKYDIKQQISKKKSKNIGIGMVQISSRRKQVQHQNLKNPRKLGNGSPYGNINDNKRKRIMEERQLESQNQGKVYYRNPALREPEMNTNTNKYTKTNSDEKEPFVSNSSKKRSLFTDLNSNKENKNKNNFNSNFGNNGNRKNAGGDKYNSNLKSKNNFLFGGGDNNNYAANANSSKSSLAAQLMAGDSDSDSDSD